tara:strand:+ start:87 stop:233 length:147 start_codon:yes stop_codon:yes gene_type:complete
MKLSVLILSMFFIVACSAQQKSVDVTTEVTPLPPVKSAQACTGNNTCK